ncbi:MAG TPA: lysine--tRNA ligase [Candidatus Dormibacteraeota bacterium]
MPGEPAEQDVSAVVRERLEKLRRIEKPYARSYHRTHTSAQARDLLGEGDGPTERVSVAGRLLTKRVFGKLSFATVQDGAGTIQLMVTPDALGEDGYEAFKDLDLGDIVGAEGPMVRTRKGEPTVKATRVDLLSKALLPLPEKWHGLKDVELRYRQRHVDLVANPEVREVFITRSRLLAGLRRYLDDNGFLEVETPVLQAIPGGGLAKPFRTRHNALDMDLYLRIALELHLKRLIVGGIEKVYEVGRVFRNEGLSPRHNPEFTMLEFYEAYADYEDVMGRTEELISTALKGAGKPLSSTYQGEELDFTPPYPRRRMVDLIREHAGVDVLNHSDTAELTTVAAGAGVAVEPGLPWGFVVNELYEKTVEGKLRRPTFVVDYPLDVSPLARKREDDPRFVERFELVVMGRELCNAFTELTDPIDQRSRFEAQVAAARAGADETHPMDDDYIAALEQGMPPTGGFGMGVDRLVMLVTDQASIRDVLFFPQLRKA